jgi:hypothetical protein
VIRKQILIIAATVTVFTWSLVRGVMGHVTAIATLAPALGMTVQQIVRAARPQTEPAPEPRVEALRARRAAPREHTFGTIGTSRRSGTSPTRMQAD